MVYVTGDTHCPLDMGKLALPCLADNKLTKNDYLIICGDAGLVWYKRDKTDEECQQFFEQQRYTTLFVDGNHENHAKLDAMPVEIWNGGKVHKLKPSVLHLMRGQVYEINGKTYFTMGGARSVDVIYRTAYETWWPREMPSDEEYAEALQNLEKHNWQVDYVITHCAPTCIQQWIDKSFMVDDLNKFLENVYRNLTFKEWYFGHYHIDKTFRKFSSKCVYDKIVAVKE